jgi:DNA polymerase-1
VGRPFVGAAGELLRDLCREVGIDVDRWYITNAVKCRPVRVTAKGTTANATPAAAHVRACSPHLAAELGALFSDGAAGPRVIVALGDTATRAVFGLSASAALVARRAILGVTQIAGEVFPTVIAGREVPVVVSPHPAYALYDPRGRAPIVSALRRAARIASGQAVTGRPTDVRVCRTVADVRAMVADLTRPEVAVVAVDTETAGPGPEGGLDRRTSRALCVSFSAEPGTAWVVPLRGRLPAEAYDARARSFRWEDVAPVWTADEEREVRALLAAFLSGPTPKAAHNGKFDLHVLEKEGFTVRNFVVDTYVIHTLLAEDQPHSLEALRVAETDVPYYEGFKASLPHRAAPYCLADPDDLWRYAGSDADVARRLVDVLLDRLADEPPVADLYRRLVHPLILAVRDIERVGLLVDVDQLLRVQDQVTRWIADAEAELYAVAGRPIAWSSPLKLASFLYTDLGLPMTKYTDHGQPAVDREALEGLLLFTPDLSPDAERALRAILRLRKLTKLRDTYLAGRDGRGGIVQWLDPRDAPLGHAWVRTTYNVGGAATGRLSSERPNLQNIPKRDADDLADLVSGYDPAHDAVRSLFVAPPGEVLVELDYSQLELRIQAELCQEKVLLEAFAQSDLVDQHRLTASLVFGVPEDQVTAAQRTDAKRANFALAYGAGVPGVCRATRRDPEWARAFVAKYREVFSATENARRTVAVALAQYGYVQNLFGRRRRFPTYRHTLRLANAGRDGRRGREGNGKGGKSELAYRAQEDARRMERQAFNFLIQSLGSDFLSAATVAAVHDRQLAAWGVRCCLTLHDALYFYVPESVLDRAVPYLAALMEGVVAWLPSTAHWRLPVEVHAGRRWGVPEWVWPVGAAARGEPPRPSSRAA